MTSLPLGLPSHGRPARLRLDGPLLAAVLLLCLGGLLAIKSARHAYPHPLDMVHKEAFGVVLGGVVMCLLALADYETLLRRYARFLYPLNLFLLAVVLFSRKLGHASHGAQRWISLGPFELQPSEVAKIILICTLAMSLAARSDTIKTWPTLLKSLAHVGLPMALIARQPDLGTALVLLGIWLGMTLIAGARLTHLGLLLLTGALLFTGMWHFNVLLKGYQKSRLEVFLNPAADPRDAGYHLRQSEIAIGSGQFTGEGYQRGRQSNGKFIPEQYTDFIFTVVGEEGGFVSCILLLALYLLVLERGVAIMAACKDTLGRLLAAGIVAMLTFHIVVNVGMTLGIMPVVGVPLPFFSYGLSSLLVNFCAIGLLMSVAARRHRDVF